jgi:xanthine dehydrogenase accessory factor
MRSDVLQLTAELLDRGEAFVLATVVWRRGPSSGKLGAQVVIYPDGKVRGWLGGACAEPTVVREALEALSDAKPRLMFIGPEAELESGRREGVTLVPMACESEGALEVYLEPMLPNSHVVVIGRSPAAYTLARCAQLLGWRATIVDDGGDADNHPEVAHVLTSLDLSDVNIDENTFVVVATQGHYDEDALRAALATSAGYVGLVSSRKRADSVIEYLRGSGVDETSLMRIRAPAGLDLGAIDHDEMAVAILAELVELKASGQFAGGIAVSRPEIAIDPICGMDVDVLTAKYVSEFDDETYYFCAAGCLRAFESDPQSVVAGIR